VAAVCAPSRLHERVVLLSLFPPQIIDLHARRHHPQQLKLYNQNRTLRHILKFSVKFLLTPSINMLEARLEQADL